MPLAPPPAVFTPPSAGSSPAAPAVVFAPGPVVVPLWASAMAAGKTGGAAGMNLLSPTGLYDNRSQAASNAYHNARGPGATPYALNPQLWYAELLAQLTCCALHTDDCGTDSNSAGNCWRARYGVVAVTRRHVVGCAHAFSHAQGTWPPNGNTTNSPPTRRRFRGGDGATVDRIQLHQASDLTGNPAGLQGMDLSVAVLDSDLPASVFIPRVAPSNYQGELADCERIALSQEWQPASGAFYSSAGLGDYGTPNGISYRAVEPGTPGSGITLTHVISGTGSAASVAVASRTITVTAAASTAASTVIAAVNAHTGAAALVTASLSPGSSGTGFVVAGTATSFTFAATPSDYPLLNRQMLHILAGGSGLGSGASADFRYGVWGGDSGTSSLISVAGELIFNGVVGGGSSASFPNAAGLTFAQHLNSLIAMADANAIALGRMATPTGYTVTPHPNRF